MLSHYENSPRQIKESELARINGELQRGTYDPLPELRSRIERDARHYRRNMISTGLTTGFLGAIGLGTMFSLTPMLIGAIAGGCFVLFSAKGVAVYSQTKKALHKDDIGDYLNDDELEDLDEYQKTFKPATEQAKQTQLMIKALCDELLEEEEEEGKDKAVDVEAKEIKEEKKGKSDGAIKTANNPVEKPLLDTENFVKPTVWMDTPGPKPTTDSLGGPIKTAKVDDVQLERLNRLEEKAADDFVFLAKDITNLKDENKELKTLLLEIRSKLSSEEAKVEKVDNKVTAIAEAVSSTSTQPSTDDELFPKITKDIAMYECDDIETADFLKWLRGQAKLKKVNTSLFDAKDAHWAKKHKCRDEETVRSFLDHAVSLGYLEAVGRDIFLLKVS